MPTLSDRTPFDPDPDSDSDNDPDSDVMLMAVTRCDSHLISSPCPQSDSGHTGGPVFSGTGMGTFFSGVRTGMVA